MDKKAIIEKRITDLGLDSSGVAEDFVTYADMLIEKNKIMNLTAITEFEDIVTKHFVDSVAILSPNVSRETLGESSSNNSPERCCEESETAKNVSRETFAPGVRVVDVGTGAGFPGLPLKIVKPDINLTLIDALRKRCDFLEEVCEEIGTDVEIIHARAEDAAKDEFLREKFDICVSRAVADLRILAEYTLPFVKEGGVLIAYKAADCEEEVKNAQKAIEMLGASLSHIERIKLPGTDIERAFVIIKKIEKTDEKYPRRAGMPEKKPL